MATALAKAQCSICDRETRSFKCEGCSQSFCLNCLKTHVEILGKEFDEIEYDHDQFRQKLNDEKGDTKRHPLIEEVDKWEQESIDKIKQTAEQCRQELNNYTNKFLIKIEDKSNDIAKELKQVRQENEFNEIDLNQFKQKLNKLKEQLDTPPNVSIKQESSTFIKKILVILQLDEDTKWKQEGITMAGGNDDGNDDGDDDENDDGNDDGDDDESDDENDDRNQLNQLSYPGGIFVDDDQTIYIVDVRNHRIVEWKCNATNGQIVAGGNGKGNQTNQLNEPTDVIVDKENNSLIISDSENRRVMRWSRKNNTQNGEIIIEDIDCYGLTMDKDGSLYVSDWKKNEVRRWKRGDKKGTIVAGGNGEGNNLNQLNCPIFIFVDEDYSLYVADRENHRVMKWVKDAKEGIVVAGGNDQGNSLTQLSYPEGVIVDQLSQIYVADFGNHRVMRWCKGAREGTIVVAGNGEGEQSNQLNGPTGLSFDREGNLYVTDFGNHRIQKFEIN